MTGKISDEDKTKVCKTCGEEKHIMEFLSGQDGVQKTRINCFDCRLKYVKHFETVYGKKCVTCKNTYPLVEYQKSSLEGEVITYSNCVKCRREWGVAKTVEESKRQELDVIKNQPKPTGRRALAARHPQNTQA